jgi:hypothetical protein
VPSIIIISPNSSVPTPPPRPLTPVMQRKEAEPGEPDAQAPGVWLPDGEVTLEPFCHPRAKRRKTSLASHSSNDTSQQVSDRGASAGADGSNNDLSKGSTDSGKEQQSFGVSPVFKSSDFCVKHTGA